MAEQSNPDVFQTIFHADLSDAFPGEDYWLVVGGDQIPLVPHTDATRAEVLAQSPHLMDGRSDVQLTHYSATPAAMPADQVVRVHLKHSLRSFPDAKGEAGVGHSALYIPPAGKPSQSMPANGGPLHFGPIDYWSTARTFLFHHPDVITVDKELGGIIVNDFMEGDPKISAEINNLALKMRAMGPPTEESSELKSGWAVLVPFTPDNPDAPKDPAGKNPFDGTHTYYLQQPTQQVQEAALPALGPLLITINNDQRFKDKKWSVQVGHSVDAKDGPEQLMLAARIETTLGDNWQAAVAVKDPITGLKASLKVIDSDKRQLEVTLTNTYIRYLGGYIRFYNADGEAMKVPKWSPDDGDIAKLLMEVAPKLQYDDMRFLGWIRPVNSILGIPDYFNPGELKVKLTFPEGAVSASVYGSGLGIGANQWPASPAIGGVLTGVFNFGVPSLMLVFSVAAQAYYPLYKIIDDLGNSKLFLAGVATVAATYFAGSSGMQRQVDFRALSTIGEFLFSPVCTKALVWVTGVIGVNTAAGQIPFVGWVTVAINIAAGLAQMAQTTYAVATSEWNIEHEVSTTITTKVTLHPDPRNKAFPQGDKRSYNVKMVYKDKKRPTDSQTHTVDKDSKEVTLPAAFPGNTLGGEVKFEADFYVDTWLAGKATTGWMKNDNEHVSQVDLYLVQYAVPLTKNSVYTHKQLLVYQNDQYAWLATPEAPKGTIAKRNTGPTGNAIGDWTGLTASQRYGMIGLAWQAAGMGVASCTGGAGGQLFAMQNINIPGTPMDAVKFPSCGLEGQTRLIYDPYPPKFLMKDGEWVLDKEDRPVPDPNDVLLGEYYIDPRPASIPYDQGGGYHLRKVKMDNTTPFDMDKNQKSWGRFPYFPDSVAMHPSGNVVGVSSRYHKLQVVKIAGEAADIDVAVARTGSGPATNKERPGLMFRPVGVACSYDGTILVLEDTKSDSEISGAVVSRISACDLAINPVNRFFDNEGKPSPWLELFTAGDYHYLDIAAVGDEKMTYIYVLYYTGDGSQAARYHMAIYQYGLAKPESNPLVVTDSISVARIAVDMWRTAYTLNFDMVTDGRGKPAGPKNQTTGPDGRTVPSVSMWLPPIPKS
ncbi:MAG: hypothetical protein ABSG65_16155 [Bryobacteraceae bacterium]